MSSVHPFIVAGLLLAIPSLARAQFDDFAFTIQTPTSVTMEFTAPPSTTPSDLTLESRGHLTAGEWEEDTNAVFALLGSDRFSVTTTRSINDARYFYRVLRDGFIVASLGSPSAPGNPVILAEGESSGIPMYLSAPFTGIVTYEVSFVGSSTAFPLTHELTNATETVLPLAIGDDATVSGGRQLDVSISLGGAGGGSGAVSVPDNDEIWDGVLEPEGGGGTMSFCTERIRFDGTERLQIVNPEGTHFTPVGTGPPLFAPSFTDTAIDVIVDSAPVTTANSPLGAAFFYRLHLNGAPQAGSGGTIFEGGNLGDAVLEKIVGLGDDVEPNEQRLDAVELGTIEAAGDPIIRYLEIADDADEDYFYFITAGATIPVIRIEFTHADGDLDLQVLDSNGNSLGTSQGTSDSEEVALSPQADGTTIVVHAYGHHGASNRYRLLIGNAAPPIAGDASHLSTTTQARFTLTKGSP